MTEPNPSHAHADQGGDVAAVTGDVQADDLQEATAVARLGAYAVPVVIVHVALVYFFAQAAFGFRLPAFLHIDLVVAWFWVNGAMVGMGVWLWKKGRIPLDQGEWLSGRRARLAILIWLGSSIAWFLLPAVLQDIWSWISYLLSDW